MSFTLAVMYAFFSKIFSNSIFNFTGFGIELFLKGSSSILTHISESLARATELLRHLALTTKAPVIVKHIVTVQVVTPKAPQPGTHRTVDGMDVFVLYNYSAGSCCILY